jgi:hypothetical protein
MKHRFLFINLLVVVLLATTWLAKSQITNVSTNSSDRFISNEEREKTFFTAIRRMLNTPIDFYGKVVDEKGNPIEGADITYTVTDKLWEDGKKYNGKSDAQGLFSFNNRGAILHVEVDKKGYYYINNQSSGTINFSTPKNAAPNYRPIPTKENPSIFVLREMGEIEKLLEIDGRQYDIPKNGEPIEINLITKQVSRGHLKIESWTEPLTNGDRFNWRYQISVLGGGLIERKDRFNFEAPLEGYRSTDELSMNATDEKWTADFGKEYFLKLAGGNYARVHIQFYPGTGDDRNFIVLKSFVNPSGSRNLEAGRNAVGGAR